MFLAALLTMLALIGLVAGAVAGQPQKLSVHLSAAGGGLLLGLSAFWLFPEIAGELGWGRSLAVTLSICALLLLFDRALLHRGHSVGDKIAGPLLVATAIHSFLDGWSIRAAAVGAVPGVAVSIGLALHKIPEGLALGWVTRRHFGSARSAIIGGTAAELFTLAGGYVEPRSELLGIYHFGLWWHAAVLAAIAGTFSFLGAHAVWPARRDRLASIIFAVSLGTVGLASHLH